MSAHLSDSVLGNLSYDYGWVRDYSVPFLGESRVLRLVIPCDEGATIESTQREAFQRFDSQQPLLLKQAESALFAHYKGICEEKRDQFGAEYADTWAPQISKPEQLAGLVRPTEIIIQETFGSSNRVVGLLFDCTWEQSLGVAVKFVNEEVSAVGPQDIVL